MGDRRDRLDALAGILRGSEGPISGVELAERLGVSRQAIVQDIATLREEGLPIVATSRGYREERRPPSFRRSFAVCHQVDQIYRELSLVVSIGGRVLDVFIDHPIYGELRGNVDVGSQEADGFHLHTVEAPSEKVLQDIEEGLRNAGFLVSF